jgi:DnaK suppressor protein
MAIITESSFLSARRDALLAEAAERRAFAQRARHEADTLLENLTQTDTQFDEESAEGDTTAVARDQLLTLAADADATADAAEAAIVRIDTGMYGVCESCGADIGYERLEALPETTVCVTCKAGRRFY